MSFAGRAILSGIIGGALALAVSCSLMPQPALHVPTVADLAHQVPAPSATKPAAPPASPVGVADQVASDAAWIGRLGGLAAVLGLALAVGLRSRTLLYLSAAGLAALFGSIALATIAPWLPIAAAILAICGPLAGLGWLAGHHKGLAVRAAGLPAAPADLLGNWARLRAHLLATIAPGAPVSVAAPGSPSPIGSTSLPNGAG